MTTRPSTIAHSVPAPIDPALLEPVLEPLGRSRSLPAAAYTSFEVYEWERLHFLERSWVCMGRAGIDGPGHQTAVRAGSEEILLVRGQDGALRGFYNACRHRGHQLLECGQSTSRRAIVCPYHAWTYDLAGGLRGAPRFGDLPADDPVHEGLVPARVAEWHGWTFVNASGDAADLADHVGDLDALIAPYDPSRLVPVASHEYMVAANWKIVVENYHECYHCPQIHPELCRVTPPQSGENYEPRGAWTGGSMELRAHAETMSLSGESRAGPLPGLDESRKRRVVYVGLFPNLLISPHPDYVMTHRIEPLGPASTRIECQWLFAPEAAKRPEFDPSYAVDFWDITNRQDWRSCESVQHGASSRGYRQGPLAAQEDAVHRFLVMVARGYLGRQPAPEPPSRWAPK